MQFTTVRSKEKDYDIYLKSEKTSSQPVGARKKCFPSYLEVAIMGSQLFSSLTNAVAAIWREKKSGSLLFGDQKMQFTTVRSKEKDYDIY